MVMAVWGNFGEKKKASIQVEHFVDEAEFYEEKTLDYGSFGQVF